MPPSILQFRKAVEISMGFNRAIGGNDDGFFLTQPVWGAFAPSCGETPEHN